MKIALPLFEEVAKENLIGEGYDLSEFVEIFEEQRKTFLSKVFKEIFKGCYHESK